MRGQNGDEVIRRIAWALVIAGSLVLLGYGAYYFFDAFVVTVSGIGIWY